MADNRRYYSQSEYVYGNTVRKTQAAPKYAPNTAPNPAPRKSTEQLRREHARKQAARRNQQQAMAMNPGYVAFLTVATIICFGLCLVFLNIRADITASMESIAALETQISEQKASNAAAQKRLETTINLNEVKLRAGEMGLTYPTADQIHYYTVEGSDYMNQYVDMTSN